MPYNINLTNGNLLSIVEEGTIDVNSASLVLIGKNFPGYGEYLNENFVRLLENFSNNEAPDGALVGQLWYDSANAELKVWKGSSWVSTSRPTIVNDTTSSTSHYLTFVDASNGTPDVKVSASSGAVYTPSTGNFGLGVSTAWSKLVVNANSSITVANAAPETDVVVHVHGATGKSPKVLVDSYGGTVAASTYATGNGSKLTLRRSNGTSAAPEAIKVNDVIATVGAQGFMGNAYTSDRSSISVVATENWTLSNNGTKVTINTTPVGSSTPATVATFGSDGSLAVSGAFRAGGDVTAYYSSDINLKTNIEPIRDALNKVESLEGITFNWNDLAVGKDVGAREAGLIAQQVKNVLEEAVIKRNDGYLAVRYEGVIPLLVEAIKELRAEIKKLKNQFN